MTPGTEVRHEFSKRQTQLACIERTRQKTGLRVVIPGVGGAYRFIGLVSRGELDGEGGQRDIRTGSLAGGASYLLKQDEV
jgi:hypothetical protein